MQESPDKKLTTITTFQFQKGNKLDRQSYIQHSSISLKQGGKAVDLDLLYEVLRHSI